MSKKAGLTAFLAVVSLFSCVMTSCSDNSDSLIYTDATPYIPNIDTKDETAETAEEITQSVVYTDPDGVNFSADVSKYARYFDPENRDDYLIIANSNQPLRADYVPENLVNVSGTKDNEPIQLCLYAARSAEAMLKEAEANGCKELEIKSGYRSYEEQKTNFQTAVDYYVEQYGYDEYTAELTAVKDTARAGESDHQTGLSVGIHNLAKSDTDFAYTKEGKWLAENCWKFGYVLRYPLDKDDYTGFEFKPWLFRYVGRYHAQQMNELDMCLEEYVQYLEDEGVYTEKIDFAEDLSAYEQYMNPEDRDAYLILVNPDHPLDQNYAPDDLMNLVDTRSDRSARKMRLYAAMALEAFLKEARANGCKDVTVTSAYRSYDKQKSTFDSEVEKYMNRGMSREEAIKKTRMDTAYPGDSEHQTGLAVDMHNMSAANVAFAKTYEAQWLAENAWKFGFILRYLPDKEDITTYTYEPWHFRYVGRYHAKRIYEKGMCLEEYIDYLAENSKQ